MGADQGQAAGWLQGRLPDAWFTGPAEVTVDREEIMVIGTLAAPEGVEGEADGPEATEAARGRISFCANSRASSRSARCSSLRANEMPAVVSSRIAMSRG